MIELLSVYLSKKINEVCYFGDLISKVIMLETTTAPPVLQISSFVRLTFTLNIKGTIFNLFNVV